MYRLLVALVVLQVSVADKSWCNRHPGVCKHRHHDYHNTHPNDADFHDVSWDLVTIDRKAQRVCGRDVLTSETYESNYYQLSLSLLNFTEDEITVKARHRVLFVQAYKPGGEEKVASVMQILPDFVKVKDGFWTFADGKLRVNLPYSITIGAETIKSCENNIDDSIVTILKRDFIIVSENVV